MLQHNLSSISFCESLDVFLVLLQQQRDQEVCGQVRVLEELLLTHLYVIHGPVETEDLQRTLMVDLRARSLPACKETSILIFIIFHQILTLLSLGLGSWSLGICLIMEAVMTAS